MSWLVLGILLITVLFATHYIKRGLNRSNPCRGTCTGSCSGCPDGDRCPCAPRTKELTYGLK